MDVEGTINFILQAQANAEGRMDKIDKRLDAITKLIQQGMRMLVRHDKGMAEIRTAIAALAAAQKRTDARLAIMEKRTEERFAEVAQSQRELAQTQKATERSLKALIDSMRHGRNGR